MLEAGSADGFEISTHAPRAGSDGTRIHWPLWRQYFNPRSPCGERRLGICRIFEMRRISTHAPRAGSDLIATSSHTRHLISTHAPRAGSDLVSQFFRDLDLRFQPTLPVRGATASTNKFETLILYHKYNFGIIP